MEQPVTKGRTPSRCREWERNRRNKFNEAISRLGDIMKEINRSKSCDKEADNVQYPKVEIVEKAIVCLKNFLQETTTLKSEIMALQVKIESFTKQDKKDASTQVFIGINKKKSNGKYVKVVMLRKSKRKALKEKSVLTPNATVSSHSNNSPGNKATKTTTPKILPTLLPKTAITDKPKKGAENAIVVLPAAPYVFSQRPLLFPSAQPTYVLFDPNIQTLNKPVFPIVNRNNGDVTKTTMVNILPITAYSRPLSASKTKKNNGKNRTKSDAVKKSAKTSNKKGTKENSSSDATKTDDSVNKNVVEEPKELIKESLSTKPTEEKLTSQNSILATTKAELVSNPAVSIENNKMNTESGLESHTDNNKSVCATTKVVEEAIDRPKPKINVADQKSLNNIENNEDKKKCEKNPTEKLTVNYKDKCDKLPNILDTGLCENTVDGGNARLELAEEFLAASPTAAFLMSFPLVSGNRADSPAEEQLNASQDTSKDTNQKRDEIIPPIIPQTYFDKHTNAKVKPPDKHVSSNSMNKQSLQKCENNTTISKQIESKTSSTLVSTVSNEIPFLGLPMPGLLPTPCSINESTFSLDYDCNLSKSMPSQSASYVSNSNIFYKSDPFNSVKSTIYSTSSISSGHEFNSFGLYPCAMEKYSSKNKSDYSNVEENLMKIGSSRLTYDIDLGWSHKGFDFVNCTSAPNTFGKDNILTTSSYSTSYNPFNPDFHVPLVGNSTKKDNLSKPSTTFGEAMPSFYSQPANLWSEDVPFYTNANVSKSLPNKHNFPNHSQTYTKPSVSKPYEAKIPVEPGLGVDNVVTKVSSHANAGHPTADKYTKKSQSKMHINWMTSETRTVPNNFVPPLAEVKDMNKPAAYSSLGQYTKKHDSNESNYFPISMINYPPQPSQEEIQTWPSSRPAGTTEISIEPPPINLPTLVGDLALGPHDKKKTTDAINRISHPDTQNCGNFLSVTQLMNRSTENLMPSRYQAPNIESTKSVSLKQHIPSLDNRKTMIRPESLLTQPCYGFGDSKTVNYDMMTHYPQAKTKTNKSDKTLKSQKNSYSAEALIRGGPCTQKHQDSTSAKFMMPPSQKYNNFNPPQDTSVAQVSHFPAILDYPENNYTGQQFSGTNLYNSTTNTISNSFYSNFMPGSSNLMTGNYAGAPFSGEFIDYNQTSECNYTNPKYDELKMRGNPPMFQQEKVSNYKSSRRETAAKHKLECSKKESNKKYQNKRAKVNSEIEDWNDGHLLWQNKTPAKRYPNLGMMEETPFPNYVGNQVSQYQPEVFNSHIMGPNAQTAGHNDRSLTTFPATSRANFNLSSIFPEMTKVQ